MTHSFPYILTALLSLCGVIACDNDQRREVPSNAGMHAAPADFPEAKRRPAPKADAGSVAAWVDDKAIAEREVQAELDRLRRQTFEHERSEWTLAEQRGWRERVIRELIDRRLLDAWVARQDVEVTEADVDAALARQVEVRFGTADAFEAHLQDRGITAQEYRDQLRRHEALERALLSDEPAPTKDAADADIVDLYDEVANREAVVREVRLSAVTVPKDHPLPGSINSFEAVSEIADSAARAPSELGWVEWSALDPTVRKQLAVTSGETSILVDAAAGRQLFWVHERRERPTDHFEKVEPIIRQRLEALRFARARDEKIRELREQASIRTAAIQGPASAE